MPAPTQHATRQAALQRLPSDVRNVYGAEVSWRPSLKFIAALRTRAQRKQIRTFAEGGGRVLDRFHETTLANSQMKKGVPITAVRMPSGISTCAMVRASVSMSRR
jgi:hypothetical protein